MKQNTVNTLINPQNGNLAFKVFSFSDNSNFDHIQRLNYYTIIIINKGNGKLKADFSEYDFNENSLLCFTPYQPFMITEKEKIEGFAINFHSDFFCIHKHQKEVSCNGVLFNNIYNPPILELERKELEIFLTITNDIIAEIKNIKMAQYELLVSYLKIFLINASRLKVAKNDELGTKIQSLEEPFILQNLKEAIEENYRSKHSPSQYGDLLNVAPKTLAKVCKDYFNKTLTDLISERIIIEAKRELYLTSKNIKQIAYELGFNDEYYFSRFFKSKVEIAPQFYRETVGMAATE